MKKYVFTQDFQNGNDEYYLDDVIIVIDKAEHNIWFANNGYYDYNFWNDPNGMNRGMDKEGFSELVECGIIREAVPDKVKFYVKGSTYEIKEQIKQAGGIWDGQRHMWYFNNYNADFETIAFIADTNK